MFINKASFLANHYRRSKGYHALSLSAFTCFFFLLLLSFL
jgi:hypothetical protein